MTTAKQYNSIDSQVYDVDKGKMGDKAWREGDTIYENPKNNTGQAYRVIKTSDNPNNGFQGMAVAPITPGHPDGDRSQTIIACAGTNFGDGHDRDTDLNQVVLGKQSANNQFTSANKFYQEVSGMSGVSIEAITGHSLGGAEAQYLAALYHLPATTFSSASPGAMLTEEEKAWLQGAGKSKVLNYMHYGDQVSSLTGTAQFGTSIYCLEMSKPNLLWGLGGIALGGPFGLVTGPLAAGATQGHYLNSYIFNPDGSTVTRPAGEPPLKFMGGEIGAGISGVEDSLQFGGTVAHSVGGWFKVESDSKEPVQVLVDDVANSLNTIKTENNNLVKELEDRLANNIEMTYSQWGYILSYEDVMDEVAKRNLYVGSHINEDRVQEVNQKIDNEINEVKDFGKKFNKLIDDAVEMDKTSKKQFDSMPRPIIPPNASLNTNIANGAAGYGGNVSTNDKPW